MDYSRVSGPFINYSDNEEQGNETGTSSRSFDYVEIEEQYQSTHSPDVNFLEIAERLLGRSELVTLQQLREDLKNAEVNRYLQLQDDNSTSNIDRGPEDQISHLVKCGENEIDQEVDTESIYSPATFPVNSDKLRYKDGEDVGSENDIQELDMKNSYSSEDDFVSNESKVSSEQIDNEQTSSDTIEEKGNIDKEETTTQSTHSEIEKDLEKSLSVKYDKESQTYICLKIAKSKGKNQLIYKVNANRTDSCISARELPYKCKFCEEAFSLFSQLKRHVKIHSLESPFTCKICGRVYCNEAELKKHAKKHDRAKPHICVECGRSFRQLHMLQNHIRTHNGEKPFLCETCGQGFGQKENLKLHERCHSDVKPHKCAVCGKQFNNTKCLHRHELTHSNERNYPCDVCGKSFLRNDHLRRHKRTHGEEPRFKCSYCGKGFHQKVNTEEHERIHTGDKPFVCEVCGKGFTQRGNLKSHLIKHTFV